MIPRNKIAGLYDNSMFYLLRSCQFSKSGCTIRIPISTCIYFLMSKYFYILVCVLVTQLCPVLCNRMDCSPPGSPVHGILQARILEWVAFPFSSRSSQPKNQTRWILYQLSYQGSPEIGSEKFEEN